MWPEDVQRTGQAGGAWTDPDTSITYPGGVGGGHITIRAEELRVSCGDSISVRGYHPGGSAPNAGGGAGGYLLVEAGRVVGGAGTSVCFLARGSAGKDSTSLQSARAVGGCSYI